MAEMPWSRFFWSDWEADQGLRLCSLAAQGLWMRMLCVCARHEPKGYLAINGNPLDLDAIARLAGAAESEVENLMGELERNGVFSRDRKGRIYSRRMVRDEKRSQEGRKHKKRGLKEASEKSKEKSEPSRGSTRGASPQKPEARNQSIPEADASGRDAPTERENEEFWVNAKQYLGRKGVPERQRGSFIGKVIREHGFGQARDAFRRCQAEGVAEPIPWITACLSKATHKPAIDENVLRILARKMEEDEALDQQMRAAR